MVTISLSDPVVMVLGGHDWLLPGSRLSPLVDERISKLIS